MSTDSRYLTTLPSALEERPSTAGSDSTAETARSEYVLAAALGERLDAPVSQARRSLHALSADGTLTAAQAHPIEQALADIHRLAYQSQLLCRVAEGRWRQTHEQLNLDSIVKRALDDDANRLQQHGVEVHRSIKPVAVVVDLDLATSLVQAAVEHAATPGARLLVSLDVMNWPAHALLSLRSASAVALGAQDNKRHDAHNPLGWHLVQVLAKAMGVTVRTADNAQEQTLTLEFARTVKQLEGLTAMEMDLDAASDEPSQAMAGHRVLIITSDIPLREDIKSICRAMGLLTDHVPTSSAAVRYCELEQPHLIIVDERFRDEQFDQLRQDLLKNEPNFPCVEIGYDSQTLSIASWMSENMTRVTRSELHTQLPQALTLEFAKIL